MLSERGIKRELSKKLNDLYNNIDEDHYEVVEALRRGTIAGGAIASYLQGEEPNDLDIYLRDSGDLLTVVKYFVDKYDLLDYVNGDKLYVSQGSVITDNALKGVAKMGAVDEENFSVDPSGVYIYVRSEGKTRATKEDIEKDKYVPVFVSSNSMTLSNGIQIIVRFSGEPEEIIKNFDYAHTLNYYDISKRDLVLDTKALTSILTKKLMYVGSRFPLCSLFRMRKFMLRGYEINAGQILKMSLQLNELNLKDVKVLKDQLIGVDSLYMEFLIKAVEKAQKEGTEITTTYMMGLVEEMFD